MNMVTFFNKLVVLLLATWTRVTIHIPLNMKESPKDVVRSFLPQLCPGIDACNGNQTFRDSSLQEHCCTECSCDPSCELTRNCCFPKGSSSYSETSYSERECLYPMISQIQGTFRRLYQSYWFVNDVKSYDNIKSYSNKTISKCGDEKIAPWGSFMPVFSKKKRKIYKNTACADADNVTDGILWDFQIICKQYDRSALRRDVSSYISNLYLAPMPQYCRLHFRYPGNISDLKFNKCFTDLISSCRNVKYILPKNLNLTTSKIIQACTSSGLVSPYRAKNMYANVFCYICNGYEYKEKETCFIDVDGNRGFTGSLITILTDGKSLSKSFHRTKAVKRLPTACSKQNTEDNYTRESCRPVHCSSGQQRDRNNNCILMVKELFMKRCEINVKLTAGTAFNIVETFYSRNFSLRYKWSNVWNVKAVSYKVLRTKRQKHLFINLVNEFPTKNTTRLLQNIEKFINLPWTLTLKNGTSIPMSAALGFDTRYFYNIKFIEELNNHDEVEKLHQKIPKFRYLYNQVVKHSDLNMIVVTKLYYCELIELNSSEYKIWEKHSLYNKLTNRLLFLGEFSLITEPGFGGEETIEKARICLEDSGFVKTEPNNIIDVACKLEPAKYIAFTFSAVIGFLII